MIVRGRQAGFTLMEVIIVLSVAAVTMVGVVTYVGLTRYSIPQIFWFENAMYLQGVMENIKAYNEQMRVDETVERLIEVQNAVGGVNTDQENEFGNYHVQYNGFIKYVPNGSGFDEVPIDEDAGDPKENLRISIQNEDGLIFTTIFTET